MITLQIDGSIDAWEESLLRDAGCTVVRFIDKVGLALIVPEHLEMRIRDIYKVKEPTIRYKKNLPAWF